MLTPQGLIDSGIGGCQDGRGPPETDGRRRGATVSRVAIPYLAAQGIRLHGVGRAFGRPRRVLLLSREAWESRSPTFRDTRC